MKPPAPETFLAQPVQALEECQFAVLPVPYERAMSYGSGASKGPAAIIEASTHLELYDEELDAEPSDLGFHTMQPVEETADPEEMSKRVEKAVDQVLAAGKFPIVLGGDHSQSIGPLRALKKRHPGLAIAHFDAHDDMREEWMGSRFNHACVMRRAYELGVKGIHVGIRSQDRETVEFAEQAGARIFRAKDRAEWKLEDMLKGLGREVYVSIDVDALDPSIMPSTGTPEPGGLGWYEILGWLRAIAKERSIVGFDIMELAPIPGLRAPDFTAAKLAYKLAGYCFEKELAKTR